MTSPLFTPFKLKNMELPNRVVMAPMTRSKSPGGVPGEEGDMLGGKPGVGERGGRGPSGKHGEPMSARPKTGLMGAPGAPGEGNEGSTFGAKSIKNRAKLEIQDGVPLNIEF